MNDYEPLAKDEVWNALKTCAHVYAVDIERKEFLELGEHKVFEVLRIIARPNMMFYKSKEDGSDGADLLREI